MTKAVGKVILISGGGCRLYASPISARIGVEDGGWSAQGRIGRVESATTTLQVNVIAPARLIPRLNRRESYAREKERAVEKRSRTPNAYASPAAYRREARLPCMSGPVTRSNHISGKANDTRVMIGSA